MSDSDEDYPSPSPKMPEYPTYEIDCNLETLMAIKPPLSVLLHPPGYTDAQLIIEGNEAPLKSMETDSAPPVKDIPFEIYSRALDGDDVEESLATDDLANVSGITGDSETFAEYGDYSGSDNSLDDLLDAARNLRERSGSQRLPDILDNLATVQDGSTCRCAGEDLVVTAEKIVICSPEDKQNRLTEDNLVIHSKGDDADQEDEEEDEDEDDKDNSIDSKGDSQNELTFGEYTFTDFTDFQKLKMKYPSRGSVSNIPQGTSHLELTKEERQSMIDEMLMLRKDTIKANRRHSWTGNLKLDLDFDLDDCKSLIVRKCSTGLDLPPKVNLYSENVVKEEETTEHVDRGSIADLAAIKKHWEQRFESEEAEKAPVKKAQRVVRHWSVKLANIPGRPNNRKDEPIPEVVNRNQEMTTAVNDDYNENESAIEREIRWAMEREEMLRQEQEQRQYRREMMLEKEEEEKQLNGVQTQQIIEHYENTDKEKFKPTYHEMTEADLGHEISKKEAIKELEMRQQKELALQNGESVTSEDSTDKLNPTPIHYRETVVQMEIRLQRERDAQFKEQQKLLNSSNKVKSEPVTEITNDNDVIVNNNNNDSPAPPPPVSEPEPEPVPEPTPAPVQETKPVLYKHEVENKIAQELEEAKAREEEFRQRIKSIESAEDLENSVKSLELNESTMSASSESDSAGPTANKTSPFLNETPIEREIRLAREREEEYRRQKGYPTSEKVSTQRSVELKTDTARLPKYNLKNKPVKGDTMKKIAASRLQHEIKQERSREVTLRESGRINTTSDERVGEQKKYKEVAEGPVKRNFVTAKKPVVKVESAVAAATESQASDADSNLSSSQKKNGPNYVIKTPKISTTFSFREAKSNAGSMIEQELKEMREREEELKKQREYMQNKANNNETNE